MANFFANYPKDFDNVGKLFANAYYGQLQADRKSVGNMYHASFFSSTLSF